MKKLMLFVLMLLGIFSCSDDDAAADKKREPLVSKITISNDFNPYQVYNIVYDAQNRIDKITVDGRVMRYVYNKKNYISTVFYDEVPQFVFHYNAQNIITHYEYADNGEMHAVTYDAAANSYRFPPDEYRLNGNDDVIVVNNKKVNFTEAKGVFANVTGKNVHLMNYFIGNFTFFGSKMGIKNVVDGNNEKMYEMATQYNDSGYPVNIDITSFFGNDDKTVTLEY